MLVPMLGLNGIACHCRFARKGNVTYVTTARIYGRLALPLLPGGIRLAGRLPASVSVRLVIHGVHLNWFSCACQRRRTPSTREHAAAVAFFEMQFGISRAGQSRVCPTAGKELSLQYPACVRRQALLPVRRPSLSFLGCSVGIVGCACTT
jgi:hypothetical protein